VKVGCSNHAIVISPCRDTSARAVAITVNDLSGLTFEPSPYGVAGGFAESALELPQEVPLVVEGRVDRLVRDGGPGGLESGAGGRRDDAPDETNLQIRQRNYLKPF
jgi:hypothetical protein